MSTPAPAGKPAASSSSVAQIGSALYSGSATLGRITSTIVAWVMTVLGVLVLIAGFYMTFSAYKGYTTGKIKAATFVGMQVAMPNQPARRQYNVTVEYVVDGKTYIKQNVLYVEPREPHVGDNVTVNYDRHNPSDMHLGPSLRGFGIILMIVGIFLPALAWLQYYLTHRFKAYAALSGAGMAYRVL